MRTGGSHLSTNSITGAARIILAAVICGALNGGPLLAQNGPAPIPWKATAAGAKLSVPAETDPAKVLSRQADRHVVVQFKELPSPHVRQTLDRSGVRLQRYLGAGAYFARTSGGRGAIAGAQAAGVVSVADVASDWKLHPQLLKGDIPAYSRFPDPAAGQPGNVPNAPVHPPPQLLALYVIFHPDIDYLNGVAGAVKRQGGTIRSFMRSINAAVVWLPEANLSALAGEDAVQWIEPPLPPLQTNNNSNRAITQADIVQAPPYGLDGSGIRVLVYDGGTASAIHPDFGGRVSVRDSSGDDGHATHVSGTIGGNGALSGGLFRGMAPGVLIESYGFEYDGTGTFLYTNPGDIEADYNQAINIYGADIASNSIGTNAAFNGFPCEMEGDYGTTDMLIDAIVNGSLGAPMRIIWANGNERGSTRCGSAYHTTAPPACAKNHIAVGALNSNDDSMTYFSSWGPTDDGRLKPDICGPGCQSNGDLGVTSTIGINQYTTFCGTSMAAPTVCGLSALILQEFRNLHPAEPLPRNSTLKILLAHNAVDLGNPGPDYKFGYGSVRVKDTIDFLRGGGFREGAIEQGEQRNFFVEVPPGTPNLKATLAWDDVPGAVNTNPELVNDLDIVAVAPGGAVYYPWTLNPSNGDAPAVRTQPDHVNNIEQVQVDAPAVGVWTIRITGAIPSGPQVFSLAATPGLQSCARAGFITLDADAYSCTGLAQVTVNDCQLNALAGTIETTTVTVRSDTDASGKPLLLTETGPDSAVFTGTMQLALSDAPDTLHITAGDTLTAVYQDSDDGTGHAATMQDTAIIDCTPPVITGVAGTMLGTTALITFHTDVPACGQVRFGAACGSLAKTTAGSCDQMNHAIRLGGLYPNATYYYAVDGEDEAGNSTTDDNAGSCYTFITAAALFFDDFPTTTLNPANWVSTIGSPTITDAGAGEPSEPYALRLDGAPAGGDGVVSRGLDLSTRSQLELSYWFKRAGGWKNDDLIVEYLNTSASWVELARHYGLRPPDAAFEESVIPLPPGAYHAAFQFRIRNSAAAGSSADWLVDHVAIQAARPLPPVAENTVVAISTSQQQVTLSAWDINGDPLTYIITSLPAAGTLTDPNAGAITTVPYVLAAGGHSVVYSPAQPDGLDSFTFKANDGGSPPQGGDSNKATVSLTIQKCSPPTPAGPLAPLHNARDIPRKTDLLWYGGPFRLLANTFANNLVELQLVPAQTVLIGPSVFSTGLDFDASGVLYGVDVDDDFRLVIINPADGSIIQRIGYPTAPIFTLAFAPAGTLYGLEVDGTRARLHTVDTQTAATHLIGEIPGGNIWGIDFAPDGTLYGAMFDLVIIDPATAGIVKSFGPLPVYQTLDIDFARDGYIYTMEWPFYDLHRIDPVDGSTVRISNYAQRPWSVGSQPLSAGPVSSKTHRVTRPAPQHEPLPDQDAILLQRQAILDAVPAEVRLNSPLKALNERRAGIIGKSAAGAAEPQPGTATPATSAGNCDTTYDVFFGSDNPPVSKICGDLTEPICDPGPLSRDTIYFWKVVSTNCCDVTAGPVWSFRTRRDLDDVIVARQLFYNNSAFDGFEPAANASDDNAIAADKLPLLPGGTAGFANYSSYDKGINGIMIDIRDLPGTPVAADFAFKVGGIGTTGDDLGTWTPMLTAPQISLRRGQGLDGSDRVTLIWPPGQDGNPVIRKEWLQVTVKATPRTGLLGDDVFYFGNAIGESNSPLADASGTYATVTDTDTLAVHNNQLDPPQQAGIDNVYDHNRDRAVDAADELIAANNQTSVNDALKLFAAPQTDTDGDGVFDDLDNCRFVSNADQADADADDSGDACDRCPDFDDAIDDDNDGIPDACDNCPAVSNPYLDDADGDGVGNVCDNCPFSVNPDQTDTDADGVGDACDNCVQLANPVQADCDEDGRGDACEPDTRYVDDDAPAGGDGLSWNTAYRSLQSALDDAERECGTVRSILVAAGIYTPTPPADANPRIATFALMKGLEIKGGHAGLGAPDPNQRDIDVNLTILSGDLSGNDSPAGGNEENCYHVLTVVDADASAVLDGFTVSGGNDDSLQSTGAGLFGIGGGATLRNCTFTNNSARNGGGVYVLESHDLTLEHCRFIANRADTSGGGLYLTGDAVVTGCFFAANRASLLGGGIYIQGGPQQSVTIVNCVFNDNFALTQGGAVYATTASIAHSTFRNNLTHGSSGAGLYLTPVAPANISNSIFWDNHSAAGTDEPAQIDTQTAVIQSCCIQGWTGELGGVGNFGADPRFALPGENHLAPDSPCIDTGQNSPQQFALTHQNSALSTDFDGNTRPLDGNRDGTAAPDIGAFEFNPLAPSIVVTPLVEFTAAEAGGPIQFALIMPLEQKLLIRNAGGGTLNWTLAATCPWLSLNPPSGTSSGQINQVTLYANVAGLTHNTYTCLIALTDPQAVNRRQTAQIEFYITRTLRVPQDYPTIQQAIDAAFVPGDTVLVDDGTYTGPGNRDLMFRGRRITVRSVNGPDHTIIDCQGTAADPHRGFVFYSGEDESAVLDGFTIINGYAAAGGGAIDCRRSGPTITHCTFQGNRAGIYGGGIVCDSGTTLSRCRITANSAGPLNQTGQTGFCGGLCIFGYHTTVADCLIAGNTAGPLEPPVDPEGPMGVGGGMCAFSIDTAIINCTLAANRAQIAGGMFVGEGSIATLVNSILWDNTANLGPPSTAVGPQIALEMKSEEDNDPARLTVRWSDVQGGQPAVFVGDGAELDWADGNIDSDPRFAQPGQWDSNGTPTDPTDDVWIDGDFRLRDGSPAIDAGDPTPPNETTDLDGNPRVSGGRVDMGAYEGQCARTIADADRHVFYNNSFYDSDTSTCRSFLGVAQCNDNTAIDPTKFALIPGNPATTVNYISYSRGINGLIIDVTTAPMGCALLPAGPLATSNFDFKVGNSTNLGSYVAAAAPLSINLTPGGGASGTDRIKIIWADNAIPNKSWLRVVVKSNASGGTLDLAADNIFYFGLAIGDSLTPGTTRVVVSSTDEIDARNHPHNSLSCVTAGYIYDYDKSGTVNSTDEIVARNNPANSLNGLLLLNPAP